MYCIMYYQYESLSLIMLIVKSTNKKMGIIKLYMKSDLTLMCKGFFSNEFLLCVVGNCLFHACQYILAEVVESECLRSIL